MALIGKIFDQNVAIVIEAKADESFGELLPDATINALERKMSNYNSKALERIVDLVKSILPVKTNSLPKLNDIRYQLLTGVAGVIAFSNELKSHYAIFIIQEFQTSKTSSDKLKINSDDLNNFIKRLSKGIISQIMSDKLYGPFSIPGIPLFTDIPDLYIGKTIIKSAK